MVGVTHPHKYAHSDVKSFTASCSGLSNDIVAKNLPAFPHVSARAKSRTNCRRKRRGAEVREKGREKGERGGMSSVKVWL